MIPWLLTGWRKRVPPPGFPIGRVGLALIIAEADVLLSAFARFVLKGRGTQAPVAPTQKLVVGGVYRHVRNPMYLAVAATIVGQGLLLGRPELVAYAVVFLATTAAFARWYDEPTLRERYGPESEAYRRAMRGWWPRRRPWNSSTSRPHRRAPN